MAYEFGATTPGNMDPNNPIDLVLTRTGEADLLIKAGWGVDPQAPTQGHVEDVLSDIIGAAVGLGYTLSYGQQLGEATSRFLEEI